MDVVTDTDKTNPCAEVQSRGIADGPDSGRTLYGSGRATKGVRVTTPTDQPRRKRTASDVFYFLFQTLPVIVAIVILTVATIAYGLIRLVLP